MASNVEELTGRMIGFRCDNHVNPKIGVEIFILELNKDARPIAADYDTGIG